MRSGKLVEQAMYERSLAAADFTGDDGNASVIEHAILKHRIGEAMPAPPVKE